MARGVEAPRQARRGVDESSFEGAFEGVEDGPVPVMEGEGGQEEARGTELRQPLLRLVTRVSAPTGASYTTLQRKYNAEREKPCWERLVRKMRKHWNSLRTPNQEEGLDFDVSQNKLYSQRVDELREAEHKGGWMQNAQLLRWGTGFAIAVVVSFLAIAVDASVKALVRNKFGTLRHMLKLDQEWEAFVYFLGHNALYIGVATALVAFLDVKAKGSGVPEIKSFLNGRKIHRVISSRTLLSKLAGVVFSVSGSLILGKEGPMMHAGAVVGAVISQGHAEVSGFGIHMLSFRSDEEKRCFVSIGCACGVAAAFSAPLGGVLFVIEEAASYWSVELTWLTFFATMSCAAIADLIISGLDDESQWGLMSQSSLVSFGSFEGASRDVCYPVQMPYRIVQLPIFMVMGAIGGLAGAAFNRFNLWISKLRVHYVTDPRVRVAEALLVSILTSVALFGLAKLYSCRPTSSAQYTGNSASKEGCEELLPGGAFCSTGEQNDLESLLLTTLDSTVRQLFHSEMIYNVSALLITSSVVMVLACLTYGTSIPSGLFVPAITMGAAWGRIVGQELWQRDLSDFLGKIDPGIFALIGAAAMLGGITRMTISIVVILIETTNNSTYSIPIMVTIMVAKLVGDQFSTGLYDMHIELQGIKFIHNDAAPDSYKTQVRYCMAKRVVVFNIFERVGDIIQVLGSCSHNGFPVVSDISLDPLPPPPPRQVNKSDLRHRGINSDLDARLLEAVRTDNGVSASSINLSNGPSLGDRRTSQFNSELEPYGVFEGTILRSELLILLFEKVFIDDNVPVKDQIRNKHAQIHWKKFYKYYPRGPSIAEVCERLSPEDFDRIIDLRPFLNPSALTIHHSVYMTRVHQLFRHLGLRHLTVTNSLNHVVGIVTRDQLSHQRPDPKTSSSSCAPHDTLSEHNGAPPEILVQENGYSEAESEDDLELSNSRAASSLANLHDRISSSSQRIVPTTEQRPSA